MNLKEKTVVIDGKTYCYSKIVMLESNEVKINNLPNYSIGKCIKKLSDINIGELVLTQRMFFSLEYFKPQHLYFLSSDKICEGDWYYSEIHNKVFQCKHNEQYFENEFKVIASTNLSLNLSKPSKQFLQVYINSFNKNKKIEKCLVQYEEYCVENYGMSDGEPITDFKLKITKGEITIQEAKEYHTKRLYTKENIIQLLDEYEQTLDDVDKEEYYCTTRDLFSFDKDSFIEWIKDKKK